MSGQKEFNKDEQELVLQKLIVFPSDRKVVIGNYGAFSKEDLIKHVEKEDAIGKIVMEMELSFLKAMAQGKLFN